VKTANMNFLFESTLELLGNLATGARVGFDLVWSTLPFEGNA
jgi:hypothetical protein